MLLPHHLLSLCKYVSTDPVCMSICVGLIHSRGEITRLPRSLARDGIASGVNRAVHHVIWYTSYIHGTPPTFCTKEASVSLKGATSTVT